MDFACEELGKAEAMRFKKRMRRLGISPVIHDNPDKNERFFLRKCADYLGQILETRLPVSSETVKVVLGILGKGKTSVAEAVMQTTNELQRKRFVQEWEEELDDPDEISDALYRLLRHGGEKARRAFTEASRESLLRRRKSLASPGMSQMEKKLSSLAKMFNLTRQEVVFAEFLSIVSFWRPAEDFFVDHLRCQDITGRRYLKTLLGMTEQELTQAQSGTLEKIGFYEADRHSLVIADDYLSFFQKPLDDFPTKNYFTSFARKTIPLEFHPIDSQVTENILKLLSVKRPSSNHILLYGPPGTGKTSYALGIARKLGISSYEILREESNTTSKRRAAILACMNMTNGGDGSLIVVDEADNLLNTSNSWFSRGETQDKGWLNQLLEEPGIRMIWITNHISGIEESVLRRFAFSVPFRPFNRRQRVAMWESVLRRLHVKKFFNAKEIHQYADGYPVSAGLIDMAIRKALETSKPDQPVCKEIIRMHLNAHQTLMNRGLKPGNPEEIESGYSLDGLNVEGNLQTLMEHLDTFESHLRRTEQTEGVRNFNLLFYGPPGAGKSELARYIASHLDRDLIVKRASDVVSPYVGETEQNISRIFAEAEDAVLVIDEADTFLFNRSRAVHSWEISQTNEFLTRMERFRGILICTTNRFEDLDQASIRRFNQKIGFRTLDSAGNAIFYKKMLLSMVGTSLDEAGEKRLARIGNLTPGDFRVVRDRFALLEHNRISHDGLLTTLEEEANIKKQQSGRKAVGFLQTGL